MKNKYPPFLAPDMPKEGGLHENWGVKYPPASGAGGVVRSPSHKEEYISDGMRIDRVFNLKG